jgi:GGDEF domain-containing protein
MVRVGAPGADVVAAVRGTLRATDTVGRSADGSLVVLLPDVDEAGAAAVAARIAEVVTALEPGARIDPLTRQPDEAPLDLLDRTLPEAAPRHD